MEMSGRLKPIVMQVERGRISAMEQKLIGIHRRRDQSAKACLSKFVDEQAVAVMPPLGWLVKAKMTAAILYQLLYQFGYKALPKTCTELAA